jgi:hypothetical protein
VLRYDDDHNPNVNAFEPACSLGFVRNASKVVVGTSAPELMTHVHALKADFPGEMHSEEMREGRRYRRQPQIRRLTFKMLKDALSDNIYIHLVSADP